MEPNANSNASSGSLGATQLISTLFDHAGGIEGIVAKFKTGGLSEIVHSWISKGDNLPVTGDQVQNVIGEDLLNRISAKTGINAETLKSQVAKYLPMIVDKLTPDGVLGKGGSNEPA